ncbi:hypothetical protein O6H91_16G014500 [Diphasiastrum complanatum]|uniref:Uncharacterized protein n=1 Tax=Diphasiastrum complanatum TaxID=34168 RepID=A0ACC2BA21_DIPCM|nr:hypothetical protein O6H91_16G014500 [Diphasiastrum complanatum]
MAVGLSTDARLDPKFAARFCEPACQNSYPNIIDLFTKLVAGEGDLYSNLLSSNQQKLLLAHNFLINRIAFFLYKYLSTKPVQLSPARNTNPRCWTWLHAQIHKVFGRVCSYFRLVISLE